MDLRQLDEQYKDQYNRLASHVMQSWEWGEFRKSIGTPVCRYGLFKNSRLTTAFQLTLHKIPLTNQLIGYLPKGPIPDKELADALEAIGQQQGCAFIKVEPNILSTGAPFKVYPKFLPSPKPMFTRYNFIIDLTQSEESLLAKMHPKTRYNIKVAQRHNVRVEERTDDSAFKIYLKLYFETTHRQGFLGHNPEYHQQVWETLRKAGMARLFIAFYRPARSAGGPPTSDIRHPVSAWMILNFKDTCYYPYGGSSLKHKEVMANNLVCWEAIRLGKKMGLKKFDMWGAANNSNPSYKDPYYGFHRFKEGFGGELVEYIGTFDLVFNELVYYIVTFLDQFTRLKAFLLRWLG